MVFDKVIVVCPGTKFVPVNTMDCWLFVTPEIEFRPVNVGGCPPPPSELTVEFTGPLVPLAVLTVIPNTPG